MSQGWATLPNVLLGFLSGFSINRVRGEGYWKYLVDLGLEEDPVEEPRLQYPMSCDYNRCQLFSTLLLEGGIQQNANRQPGRFGKRRKHNDTLSSIVLSDEVYVPGGDDGIVKFSARLQGQYYTYTFFGTSPGDILVEHSGLVKDGSNFATPIAVFPNVDLSKYKYLNGYKFLENKKVLGKMKNLLVSEHPSIGSEPMTINDRTDTDTTSLMVYLKRKQEKNARNLCRGELQEILFQLVMSFVITEKGVHRQRHVENQNTLKGLSLKYLFLVVPDRGRASRTSVIYNLAQGKKRFFVSLDYGVRKLLSIDDPRNLGTTPGENEEESYPTLKRIYREITAQLFDIDVDYFLTISKEPEAGSDRPPFEERKLEFFEGGEQAPSQPVPSEEDKKRRKEQRIQVLRKYFEWFEFGVFLGAITSGFSPTLTPLNPSSLLDTDVQTQEYSAYDLQKEKDGGISMYHERAGIYYEKVVTIRGQLGYNNKNRVGTSTEHHYLLEHPYLSSSRFLCMDKNFNEVSVEMLLRKLSPPPPREAIINDEEKKKKKKGVRDRRPAEQPPYAKDPPPPAE
jgi:hypothetical protein